MPCRISRVCLKLQWYRLSRHRSRQNCRVFEGVNVTLEIGAGLAAYSGRQGVDRAGQIAAIKLESFAFTRYGFISGAIVRVSDDTVGGPRDYFRRAAKAA